MYQFIGPLPNHSLYRRVIFAKDIEAAFEDFRANHWKARETGWLGIWQDGILVARLIPSYDADEERIVPRLDLLPIRAKPG